MRLIDKGQRQNVGDAKHKGCKDAKQPRNEDDDGGALEVKRYRLPPAGSPPGMGNEHVQVLPRLTL